MNRNYKCKECKYPYIWQSVSFLHKKVSVKEDCHRFKTYRYGDCYINWVIQLKKEIDSCYV